MRKVNINKYISLLFAMGMASIFMYSCSDDTLVDSKEETGEYTSLSISLEAPQAEGLRASGKPDIDAEKKIYSLEVLVFKSQGEEGAGTLDGYKAIKREEVPVTGEDYDSEYKAINDIQVTLTTGIRDIYVIANAPDEYFKLVTNRQEFLDMYEDLNTQGRVPHPGTTGHDPEKEPPIGGFDPSDWKTNLTMCNYIENVSFDNTKKHHFLGYTSNGGIPSHGNTTTGKALFGANPFHVERLVARVGFQKITFDLPASLPFEPGNPSGEYSYQLDSVFMMNVRTNSKFVSGSTTPGSEAKFGHGSQSAYNFLHSSLNNLAVTSQYPAYLFEPITAPAYDVTAGSYPLWFYAFENQDANQPTYFVIGVRYNFKSGKDGSLKTMKCYYPVVVNKPGSGSNAHDYIKRNNQYQISVTIKGLGVYADSPQNLRGALDETYNMEITETVGQNLFPWTGNTYK